MIKKILPIFTIILFSFSTCFGLDTSLFTDGFVNVVAGKNKGSGSVIKVWDEEIEKETKHWGYAITCNHVVLKEKDVKLWHPILRKTGEPLFYGFLDGNVVFNDEKLDVAIIKFENKLGLKPISVANFEEVENVSILDPIYSVGTRINVAFFVRRGEINAIQDKYFYQDAGAAYGVSGGPLLNKDFKQIGIHWAFVRVPIDEQEIHFPDIGIDIKLSEVYKLLGEEKTLEYFGVE